MEGTQKTEKWFAPDTDHIGVLDGIRAIAILIVVWFHFWQQTWLMPYYPTPFLNWLGISAIDFNILRRCGYLCVDLLILLSGFVLFLPYAKNRIEGKPVDSIGMFWKKRVARIVPSYVFAVLVMFFVALYSGAYGNNTGYLWRDLLSHLTFTFLIWPDTMLHTPISGVFWTVAVEMLFYAIFPLLAKLFRKHPIWTYLGMIAIGLCFTFGFCLQRSDLSFLVNRFLTFFPVFANGMLGAYFYIWYANKAPHKPLFSVLGTVLAAGSLVLILRLFQACSSAQQVQAWQLQWRFPLSLAYLLFVLGMSISVRPIRFLLSNAVLRSIAQISYNLYLWHHFLIVRLRMAFGCSSGADVAALGAQTQWILNFEGLALAFVMAILTTYCIEKPLQRLILTAGRHSNRIKDETGEEI